MSPIMDKLKKENSYAAISGDFNINLLQTNEREIAKRSYSILDQIFCKVPCKEQADISASILLSGISGHFPCVVNFKILNKKPRPPRYVYKDQ